MENKNWYINDSYRTTSNIVLLPGRACKFLAYASPVIAHRWRIVGPRNHPFFIPLHYVAALNSIAHDLRRTLAPVSEGRARGDRVPPFFSSSLIDLSPHGCNSRPEERCEIRETTRMRKER